MTPDRNKYLFDAIQAAKAIGSFTQGKTKQEYSSNLMLRSAVERQFEILGEAFSKLDAIDPELRHSQPDVGRIIGMRNRIIHGYDSVDDNIMWDAVNMHIPALLKWLESEYQ
jgi:uncharacterized protein with HEPN domain